MIKIIFKYWTPDWKKKYYWKQFKNIFGKYDKKCILKKGIGSLLQTWFFKPPPSLQPDSVNLWNFKLRFFDQTESLKYLKSTTLGCKDKGIIKSEFVAKTQFLCKL